MVFLSIKPAQRITGNLGYFGNLGSVFESSQSTNVLPRSFEMTR